MMNLSWLTENGLIVYLLSSARDGSGGGFAAGAGIG